MNQDKMHLVKQIFNNETIRTIWDKEAEKYYISVVDIIGAVSESKDKQAYWRKLKQRLKDEEIDIKRGQDLLLKNTNNTRA